MAKSVKTTQTNKKTLLKRIINYFKRNITKFAEECGNYLKKIVKIFLTPVEIIIYLLDFIIVKPFLAIQDKLEQRRIAKNNQNIQVQKAISSILGGSSNIFSNIKNKYVAGLFSGLLQSISFFTTYAGFTFFLGPVISFGPLFMAITVQGLCWYLMNFSSVKKRRTGWQKTFLLFLLICTSTITSYIGVFNSVARPIENLTTKYDSYVETVNTLIDDELKLEENVASIDKLEIETIFDAFKQRIDNVTDDKNDLIAQKHKNVHDPKDTSDGIIYILNTERSNHNKQIDSKINKIDKYKNNISEFITTHTAKDIFDTISAFIKDPNSSEDNKKIYMAFSNIVKDLDNWNKLLDEETQYSKSFSVEKIMDMHDNSNGADTLKELKIETENENGTKNANNPTNKGTNTTQKSEVKKSTEDSILMTLFKKGIKWLKDKAKAITPKELASAEEKRLEMQKTIDNNYSKLRPLLSTENQKKLDTAKNCATLENTQILAFTLPFKEPKDYLGKAIFSFLVAAIIDILSLLISGCLILKNDSVLYRENIKNLVRHKEEMIENCFTFLISRELINQTQTLDKKCYKKFIIDYMNTLIQTFLNIVHRIYVPSSLNAFGYIDTDELNNNGTQGTTNIKQKDIEELIETFRNASLLTPISGYELKQILKNKFSHNEINSKEGEFNSKISLNALKDDKIYYLVSKNLHLWICENFSELYMNYIANLENDDT